MKIIKNESVLDRSIRFVIAIILFIVGAGMLNGVWQIVFYVLSAIMLITAVLGFCGLYKLFGINTNVK